MEHFGRMWSQRLLVNTMALKYDSQSALRTSAGISAWFNVTSGVRQGCVLLPLLYIIYIYIYILIEYH
jgi:uncharacterized membrane protein YhdT